MTTADNKTLIKTNRCIACNALFDPDSIIINHHIQYFPEEIQVMVHKKCYQEIYNTNKYPLLRPDADQLLRRILSYKKRQEILDILESPFTPHFRRVFLASFLKFAVGLTNEEICLLIEQKNKWRHKNGTLKYDPEITRYMVRSVRKASEKELAARTTPTSPKASVAGESPRFPCFTIPKTAETVDLNDGWIGIKSNGVVMDWIRKEFVKEAKE